MQVTLADETKKHLGTLLGERDKPKFVDNDQVLLHQAVFQSAQAMLWAEMAFKEMLRGDLSSLSLRVDAVIDLAYVLLQLEKVKEAMIQLDQAENLLEFFPEEAIINLYAKLWSYRAWGSEQLGILEQSLDQATKSLVYWRKLPESDTSQKTVIDMISRVRSNL